MKYLIILMCTIIFSNAGDAIRCGDASIVKGEANAMLHQAAQKRAQKDFESLVGKKLQNPTPDPMDAITLKKDKTKIKSDPIKFAEWIEFWWCETPKTPLHEAYFRYYTSMASYENQSK